MANHYTFGIGQPHTEVEDDLPPVMYDETTQSLVSGDGSLLLDLGSTIFPGALVCDWNTNGTLSLISSNGGGEAAAVDSTVTCDGLPMAKFTQGTAGTYMADFVFTSPIYLAQMQTLQIPIRWSTNVTAWTGSTNSLQIWLYSDSGGTLQWRLAASLRALDGTEFRPGVTHTVSIGAGTGTQGWTFSGATTTTTEMDAGTIYKVRIVAVTNVPGETVHIGTIRANGRAKPVVTITMDGQYSSQHNFLLPMLEAQGLRCSLAIQGSVIGDSGRMTVAQLDRAYQAGHEFISWGFDASKTTGYNSAADWPTAASITADINANNALMSGYGWTRGIGYAVHGGSTNNWGSTVSADRKAIVLAGFQAAGIKAIRRGNYAAGFLTRQQNMARVANVDPYTVSGAVQWTSTNDAASLTAIVTACKLRGEWAIYTGHRSVVSSAGSLEILNSDALSWIQALGDDVRSGKVLCLPFGEAYRYYGLTS